LLKFRKQRHDSNQLSQQQLIWEVELNLNPLGKCSTKMIEILARKICSKFLFVDKNEIKAYQSFKYSFFIFPFWLFILANWNYFCFLTFLVKIRIELQSRFFIHTCATAWYAFNVHGALLHSGFLYIFAFMWLS
jgi:hypothetical protein